jgi:hypothetical protein
MASRDDYVVVDYKGDNYDECGSIETVEERLEELVESYGLSDVKDKLDRGDILVIKGTVENITVRTNVKIEIN